MSLRSISMLMLLATLAWVAGCKGPAATTALQSPTSGAPATEAKFTVPGSAGGAPAATREITDMADRKVMIPEKLTKVYASDPYTTVLLHCVAPDLSIGFQPGCLPIGPDAKRFLNKTAAALPVLATQGPAGEQMRVNIEAVLKLHPDIAIAMGGKEHDIRGDPRRAEQKFSQIKLPVVFIDLNSMDKYPDGIDYLGQLLGREDRAKRLSTYTRQVYAKVAKMLATIPPEKRVRVYYAESADGLATESDRSFHADAIRMAGGNIVHHGDIKTHQGMEKISLEQVLLYNPEVIVSQEPDFATMAYKDPRWQKVKAVVNHRIYLIPRSPYDWIDRPPGIVRIMGVQWLAYCFYPKQYPTDIRADIREFHQMFMGIDIANSDMNKWVNQ